MRGWPLATVAFYGPDLSRATKVAVGIVKSEPEGVGDLLVREHARSLTTQVQDAQTYRAEEQGRVCKHIQGLLDFAAALPRPQFLRRSA